jgi:hypothetical protein
MVRKGPLWIGKEFLRVKKEINLKKIEATVSAYHSPL